MRSYFLFSALLVLLLSGGCDTLRKEEPPALPVTIVRSNLVDFSSVALGIDVLEEQHFAAIAGKKIGLLTHPAGVNRRGTSTIDILRAAPGVKLIALFAPEHGFDGQIRGGDNFNDARHAPTGLPIYSLHGVYRKPTRKMLTGLDAVVIDLQDIGVRSYTFISAMRLTMEACFENGVEVVVLDRPNPLGGLKVDGPPLDRKLKSYVGSFRVPYVHGLTIGEFARLAKEAPGVLDVPAGVREKGRLTVVAMRGWLRRMRWPETGLTWIPTSPYITSFEAVVGNAMVGLGCEPTAIKTWISGIGASYPFRGIGFPGKKPDEIIAALAPYHIPGIQFVKKQGVDPDGRQRTGVYVEVTDWEAWRPTELSFYMMKVSAGWKMMNPFATLSSADARTFNIHVGSIAWFDALQRDGAQIDVELFVNEWRQRALIYQKVSKSYWLYQ